MSTTQDSAPVKLKFLSLPDSDKATFERVLSFFSARGNTFELTEDDSPDFVVTTDDYSNVEEALNLLQLLQLLQLLRILIQLMIQASISIQH